MLEISDIDIKLSLWISNAGFIDGILDLNPQLKLHKLALEFSKFKHFKC